MQAKVYYSLKTMARKFRKYGQVENIAVPLKKQHITLITKRKKIVNALIGLIHGVVARVVSTEERNVNVSKSVV